ncbi:MAG: hypothetical protein CMJ31_01080 [Phycisphaerae bacterium]|nr:hypothetical protein [Phycisphaerae bacterium]
MPSNAVEAAALSAVTLVAAVGSASPLSSVADTQLRVPQTGTPSGGGFQPPAESVGRITDDGAFVFQLGVDPFRAFGVALYSATGTLLDYEQAAPTPSGRLLSLRPTDLDPGTYYVAAWGGSDGPPTDGFGVPTGVAAAGAFLTNFSGNIAGAEPRRIDGTPKLFKVINASPTTTGPIVRVISDDAVVFDAGGTGYDAGIALFDDFGLLFGQSFDRGAGGPAAFTAGPLAVGQYFAAIGSGWNAAGPPMIMTILSPDAVEDVGSWSLNVNGKNVAGGTTNLFEHDFVSVSVESVGSPTQAVERWTTLRPVHVRSTGSLATSIAVFDSAGDLLASDSSGAPSLMLDLDPGLYTVAYTGGAGAAFADGRSVVQTSAVPSGNATLRIGDFTTYANNALVPAGDTDFFRFSVEDFADLGEVAESVQPWSVFTTSDDPTRNTKLAVWRQNGQLVAEDNNSGADLNARIDLTPLAAGNYFVAVASNSTTFGPNFQATVDGNEQQGPYRLNYQPAVFLTDTAEYAGDVDYFRVRINAPTDLGSPILDTETASIDTFGSAFDTAIALWDAAGNLIERNDNAAGGTRSRIQRPLSGGEYYFAVGGSGMQYSANFGVQPVPTVTGAYEGRVNDLLYSGNTSLSDKYDFFRFRVADVATVDEATDLGVIGVEGTVVIQTLGSDFDTNIGLFDATGDLIASNNDFAPPVILQSFISTSLSAGEYFVAVAGAPNGFSDGFQIDANPTPVASRGAILGQVNMTVFDGELASRESRLWRFEIASLVQPCGNADIAAPIGELDIADVVLFLQYFGARDARADFSAPIGAFDVADVVSFLQAFGQGCP